MKERIARKKTENFKKLEIQWVKVIWQDEIGSWHSKCIKNKVSARKFKTLNERL